MPQRQWDKLVDRLFDLDRQYPLLGQTVEREEPEPKPKKVKAK